MQGFIKNLNIFFIFAKIKMFLEKPCRVQLRSDNCIVLLFLKNIIKQYAVKVKQYTVS